MSNLKLQAAANKNKSTSSWVTDTLRMAIISKDLAPGQRIVEAKIAKDLNVSITPVRDAFSQLAKEGLLDSFPFKGTYVKKLTKKFIEDVMYVRKVLEVGAASLAFENITNDDLQTLLYYSTEADRQFTQEKNLLDAIEYDQKFHTFFFEKADNKELLEMWNLLQQRDRYIQSFTKPVILNNKYNVTRHIDIVDAIRNNDKDLFINDLVLHIENSITYKVLEDIM